MTNDGSQQDAAPHSTSRPAAPVAWLPLTPRGVAAFAHATFSRLFIVQLIVALPAAAAVTRFLNTAWCPVLREAIRQLPEQGVLRDGQLQIQAPPIVPAQTSRFLTVTIDPENLSQPNLFADLRLIFRKENVQICGALGCLSGAYPKMWILDFNRAALEPWWGAWEPALLAGAGVAVMATLLLIWTLLATIYAIPARLAALYTTRHLTLAGSWRLA